jgi:hypothetical protein
MKSVLVEPGLLYTNDGQLSAIAAIGNSHQIHPMKRHVVSSEK